MKIKAIGVYLEANVTHLFGANQTRCFDLCSAGSSSRYMLAQKLNHFRSNTTLEHGLTLAPSVDGAFVSNLQMNMHRLLTLLAAISFQLLSPRRFGDQLCLYKHAISNGMLVITFGAEAAKNCA